MLFPTITFFTIILLVTSVLAAPISIGPTNVDASNAGSQNFRGNGHSVIPCSSTQRHNCRPLAEAQKFDSNHPRFHENMSMYSQYISQKAAPVATTIARRSIFSKIKKGFKKMGNAIKKGVSKAVNKVKQTAQKVTSSVKKAANKVGNDVKKAAAKVKKFAKDYGAKIAKVGLKGVATYYKLASHAAAFIPGIGKPLGRALKAASMAADFASDKIPVKLEGKWAKASGIMNKIKNPLGGAAGQALDAILKRDLDTYTL